MIRPQDIAEIAETLVNHFPDYSECRACGALWFKGIGQNPDEPEVHKTMVHRPHPNQGHTRPECPVARLRALVKESA